MCEYYSIAMDVHSRQTHVVILTPTGRCRDERTVDTTLSQLCSLVKHTPRPRRVVFEEGPLAGWLYRNLKNHAEVVVAETRRNAHIAKDGDKSDSIDAQKLAQLERGGFIRPVYHHEDLHRALFKELVTFYDKRVKEKTRRGNQLIWMIRQHGLVVGQKHFAKVSDRPSLLAELPDDRLYVWPLEMAFADYDLMAEQVKQSRRELIHEARQVEMIRRLTDLPGVSWIRASMFYALIDTPFRFRRKSALWRY